MDDAARDLEAPTGLAHVATASFLASRAVPTGGFAVALAGGVALARAAQRGGLRSGWGASLAAMLQTVAIMGPTRVGIPLTQAISAPVLGRMETRGRGTLAQALAAGAIRTAHHVPGTAFYVWVILGPDAFAGSYDRLLGFLPLLPSGLTGALIAAALGLVAWTIAASTVQALVYRRGLRRWPAGGEEAGSTDERVPEGDAGPESSEPDAAAVAPEAFGREGRASGRFRFDPRAVTLAAVVAFTVLVISTAWALLAAVAAWLAFAWFLARGDARAVRPGVALAAFLAVGTLTAGLVGGLGVEVTLRRTLRAGLLVLVATWLRYAAGEDGLREVFGRALRRLRRFPAMPETEDVLRGLGSPSTLAASGRRLVARMDGVDRRPVPITDVVLGWVAGEAGRYAIAEPGSRAHAPLLRARSRDALLVLLAAATALALPFAA